MGRQRESREGRAGLVRVPHVVDGLQLLRLRVQQEHSRRIGSQRCDALFGDDLGAGWDEQHERVRGLLMARFAEVHSLALQQTLWEMGRAVLEAEATIAEVRLTASNLHHFLTDLEPFGLDNPGAVYFAADRPYGLIQANVVRDDAPDPGLAWHDDSAR